MVAIIFLPRVKSPKTFLIKTVSALTQVKEAHPVCMRSSENTMLKIVTTRKLEQVISTGAHSNKQKEKAGGRGGRRGVLQEGLNPKSPLPHRQE